MDSCYPVLRHGLIRLLLLPPPSQRCSAKSFNKLICAKNCNANKPTPGQGGISFGKMFFCVCVFLFGWLVLFCWQSIMWIGLSSVFFWPKTNRLFSGLVKGRDFHIHVLWTQLDYFGWKELEESEIIQVVSQAEHVCLNALDTHPVVPLFYLLFKICQLWKIFLYLLILSMGYISSFSYSWWISQQFTLRSHYISLVEKPTFNINVTVIYTHSDVSL